MDLLKTSGDTIGDVKLVSRLVDRLPNRLWGPGNTYLGARLHFCVGRHPKGRTVRTVEWKGREIAHGEAAGKVPRND